MSGPGKRWTSSRQQSDLANVLRRPVETTRQSGRVLLTLSFSTYDPSRWIFLARFF
jgi:hypothetical protein